MHKDRLRRGRRRPGTSYRFAASASEVMSARSRGRSVQNSERRRPKSISTKAWSPVQNFWSKVVFLSIPHRLNLAPSRSAWQFDAPAKNTPRHAHQKPLQPDVLITLTGFCNRRHGLWTLLGRPQRDGFPVLGGTLTSSVPVSDPSSW